MYLSSIIVYLSWPVLIIFSYYMVRWALRKFESKLSEEQANKE